MSNPKSTLVVVDDDGVRSLAVTVLRPFSPDHLMKAVFGALADVPEDEG